jgi:predicted enzyme related to lactoylglutathione lyase
MTQQLQPNQTLDPIAAVPPAAGRFVWHDLMTTDLPGAVQYYTRLFGWTTRLVEMGPTDTYTMIQAGGADVGGMVPLDASLGIPSHWIGYATVDDVDAACARAASLGGKVCVPATDIPNAGRFAVLEDPAGAIISPFRGIAGPRQEPPDPRAAGAFCWDELLTPDPERIAAFYEGVFGWSHYTADMGAQGTYWLFRGGEKDMAGMMRMPADATARPFWLPYIAVDDVDAAAREATALGGKIYVQPSDIPGVGRFSVTADPTGATVALLRASR